MENNNEQNKRLNELRYFFEHRRLPKWIEQDSNGQFLAALLQQQGQILYAVMKDLCKEGGISMPYTPQDYTVALTKLTEEKNFCDYNNAGADKNVGLPQSLYFT